MKVILGGLLILFGAAIAWGGISGNLPNMVAAIGGGSEPAPNSNSGSSIVNPLGIAGDIADPSAVAANNAGALPGLAAGAKAGFDYITDWL